MALASERPLTQEPPSDAPPELVVPGDPAFPATSAGGPPPSDDVILKVKDLRTYFFTYDGVVRALDGVTFSIRKGETIGLVGETGCGKSVTAFSITRLVADPPGRLIGGEIIFQGANLLWGLDREAKIKNIKKTVRAKVTRRYRRIKAAQRRLSSVRGSKISMIFQEPMAALNPVFSINHQIAETLLLHRLIPTIDELLSKKPPIATLQPLLQEVMAAAREPGQARLRATCRAVAQAAGLVSLETELYYIFRGLKTSPESKLGLVSAALSRLHLKGAQRTYLIRRRQIGVLEKQLHGLYLQEMREGRSHATARRAVDSKILGIRLSILWGSLPIVKRFIQRPLDREMFWQTVRLLEGVGIANPVQVAKGYPHELSGGMIQRVMIAMALAPEPDLLIADEPTTALDVTIQAQILDLMRDLKTRIGTSIMLITHDLGVVAEVCDRVAVMYAGNIVEVGPVRSIFAKPLHPYSQGLLASIPRMDDPDKKLESIPGSVPNLIRPPGGCRFHPRCSFAMEKCKTERPPMTQEGPGHAVACWLYSGPEATGY